MKIVILAICCFLFTTGASAAVTFSDNFNDSFTDTSWWEVLTHGGGTAAEVNGHLEINQGSQQPYFNGYRFRPLLRGDFVATVDFALTNLDFNGNLLMTGSPGNVGVRLGDPAYYTAYFPGVQGVEPKEVLGSKVIDLQGAFRFDRVGTAVSAYYKSVSTQDDWVLLGDSVYTASDIGLGLYYSSSGGSICGPFLFDNFSVTAGFLIDSKTGSVLSVVPEPVSMVLFSLGGIAMGFVRKTQRF